MGTGASSKEFSGSGQYGTVTNFFSPSDGPGTIAFWCIQSSATNKNFWGSGSSSYQIKHTVSDVLRTQVSSTQVNGSSMTNDVWYHVCITWTSGGSGTHTLYENGVSVNSNTVTPVTNTATHCIASSNTSGGSALDGNMCHVHVYNRALSVGEVVEIMHKPGQISKGLQMYIPCTDASTSTGLDFSGNGRNCTWAGTPTNSSNGPI